MNAAEPTNGHRNIITASANFLSSSWRRIVTPSPALTPFPLSQTMMDYRLQQIEEQQQQAVTGKMERITTRLMRGIPYNILSSNIAEDIFRNPDPTIQLAGNRGIAIYTEMQAHPTIDSAWTTRQNNIRNLEWEVLPASQHPEDIKRADFIRDALMKLNSRTWNGNNFICGFPALIRGIQDGQAKGYSGTQLIWNLSTATIVETIHEIPQAFDWRDPEHESFYSQWTGKDLYFKSQETFEQWTPAPPMRFCMAINNGLYDNPFGTSIFWALYWAWFFGYVHGFKYWAGFCERFGYPSIVAKMPFNQWKSDIAARNTLLEIIKSIQADFGGVIPYFGENTESIIEFLESQRQSSVDVFEGFLNHCDDWMIRVILGQTLTTKEAQFGTRAQSQVTADTTGQAYIGADAEWIASIINYQLIVWMCDMRFGQPQPSLMIDPATNTTKVFEPAYPKFRFRTEPPKDIEGLANMLGAAKKLVRVADSYIYDQLTIPPFDPEKDTETYSGMQGTTAAGFPGQGATATTTTADELQINDNLKNMTGRQQQQFLRVIRQHGQGKVTTEQARILLRGGYGFTEDEITQILGLTEPDAAQLAERIATRITGIDRATKDAIRALVARAQAEGKDADWVERQLRDILPASDQHAEWVDNYEAELRAAYVKRFGHAPEGEAEQRIQTKVGKYAYELHRNRTMTVAETEMARAENNAALRNYREAMKAGIIAGDATKTWIVEDDPCPVCADLAGSVYLASEDTPESPGTIHNNCRCHWEFSERLPE